LRYQVDGKGMGNSSRVLATLALSPQGEGAHLHWAADITDLGGLLRAVPHGLIQGAAERVIRDAWAAIDARIVAEASA
jgi:carbon monoxide dehydrogenase subunit G